MGSVAAAGSCAAGVAIRFPPGWRAPSTNHTHLSTSVSATEVWLPNGEAFVVSLDCCIFLVMVVRKHETCRSLTTVRPSADPASHWDGTARFKSLFPGPTAPATVAQFEATSVAPAAEARRNFSRNLDECSMGPFCVGVPAPANEEVDGTRNRPSPPICTSIHRPIKLGPLFTSPKNSGVPVKIFLPVTACSCPTARRCTRWRPTRFKSLFGD